MLKNWIFTAALVAVLPFALAACDDDDNGSSATDRIDDVRDEVTERAGQVQDTPQSTATQAPTEAPTSAGGAGVDSITVTLAEVNASGVSGTAEIRAEGANRVRVTFGIDASGYVPPRDDDDDDDDDDEFEAGIWEGACDTISGEPRWDLDDIDLDDDDDLTETAPVGIQELQSGNYVVAIVGDDFDDDDDDDDDIDDDRLLACGPIE